MKILFICKYNRFRSKIAEAYFNKINKNKKHKVKSGGIIIGSYPLDKEEIKVAREFGIKLRGRPKAVSSELLRWQDKIIIVADNVPKQIFKSRKYKRDIVVWKIPDVAKDTKEAIIRKIIKSIITRVDTLF